MLRDGTQNSLWQKTVTDHGVGTPLLPTDMVDVVVVGGGITGISTALALVKAGKRCVLLEAHNIGFGTTGGTTAHINTFLELSYDRMISAFGEESARLVARGALEAYDRIKGHATLFALDCDWKERDAYMFARDAKQAEELDRIVEGTGRVGLQAKFVDVLPFPAPFTKAARFPRQAEFHPLRYLHGLAHAFVEAGGILMEDCRVLDVETKSDALLVKTKAGVVRAAHLVYATHVPPGVNILHFRNAPYRSYVLAARLSDPAALPDALINDMDDPYRYYRSSGSGDDRLLIAGGYDHKTGHEEDTRTCSARLEAHVRALFPVKEITHQWSSQYFEPADGLPYIGRLPMADDRIFVATGLGGNGMTYGTMASIVITDLIVTGSSPYEDVFKPSRVSIVAGFANFVKEAADVVGHLAAAPFPAERMKELGELPNGEARVVQHDGRSIAVHRDDEGVLHAVDPACSHIKCTVAWNSAERSWDCPCHGSRFSIDGQVLNAPARNPLQAVDPGAGKAKGGMSLDASKVTA